MQNNNTKIKKYSYLKDIQDSNVRLKNISYISLNFERYEIKDGLILGKGKKTKKDIEKIIETNNKIDILMDLLNIGRLIFDDENLKKEKRESYEYENKLFEKPHILVDITKINQESKRKINKFFEKYGIIQNDKYNLNFFIRRVLDLYYTVEIWNMLENKENYGEKWENLQFILYPLYRSKNVNSVKEGIAANIQEKGLFEYERNKYYIFDYFQFNCKTKTFQTLNMCNDYITLAYYQLENILIYKGKDVFQKCKICGDYLDYERSSKEYCDSEECRKIRQRERTRKSRENKKRKELNK